MHNLNCRLVVGSVLANWKGEIIGISPGAFSTPTLLERIPVLAKEAGKLVKIEFDSKKIMEEKKMIIDDSYIGPGYGEKTELGTSAIELFARNEGIFLDNVYTAKAAAGMFDYIKKGRVKPKENVLFIHTGGSPELFQ